MLIAVALSAIAATHDPAVWTGALIQANLHPERTTGPRLWVDLHARSWENGWTSITRPAVGWDLAPGVSAFVGYAWIPTVDPANTLTNEHRSWVQLVLQPDVGAVSLAVRPRLEQRFSDAASGVGHRARLWARVGVPVSDALSIVVTDELFVGLVDTGWSVGGFDQNRAFVGITLPLAASGRIELGYLDAMLLRGGEVLHQHVASTLLVLSL